MSIDWRDRIKAGDILMFPSGPRVVRKTTYRKSGALLGCDFTIMRCSWTKRCYTVMTRCDLVTRGALPTGLRYRFRTRMDKRISKAIYAADMKHLTGKRPNCCTVKGIR